MLNYVKVEEAANFIKSHISIMPSIAMVLGSGLGDVANKVKNAVTLLYKDIPNFPQSTVEGHQGQLVIGDFFGENVAVFKGRVHYYEGYSMSEVVFPIRLARTLGARYLIVTNAAGGLNPEFVPGDLMLIRDHINLMGQNPLIGPNEERWGARFPGMENAYSLELRKIAFQVTEKKLAERETKFLKEGVYIAVSGPSYETQAEIKFLKSIGADAVGMSTVPEVIAARHMGMEVLGISCITNVLHGHECKEITPGVSHQEVVDAGKKASIILQKLFQELIPNITI